MKGVANGGEREEAELTGLRTHRDALCEALAVAASLCCLVDIDGLIWVNDTRGHQEGDRVVAAVAHQLEVSLTGYPTTLFRVGGDEFLAVARGPACASLRDIASKLVEDIRTMAIPYGRVDRPHRTCLEVNSVLMSSTDAAAGLSERTGVTEAFRNWFGEAIYREKKRLGVEAGVVVDLVKSRQPPLARG